MSGVARERSHREPFLSVSFRAGKKRIFMLYNEPSPDLNLISDGDDRVLAFTPTCADDS